MFHGERINDLERELSDLKSQDKRQVKEIKGEDFVTHGFAVTTGEYTWRKAGDSYDGTNLRRIDRQLNELTARFDALNYKLGALLAYLELEAYKPCSRLPDHGGFVVSEIEDEEDGD